MADRFTVDGGDRLEAHLCGICEMARAGVANAIPARLLQGLLLGGGYGRGEGGVLKCGNEERPYNDLEFYILIRGFSRVNERRFHSTLHGLSERLTSISGVEVEFKIISQRKLESSPVNMGYYDLMMGNRLLLGDSNLFTHCSHHRNAETIPLSEATRLLMNRCSGLLFAKARLEKEKFSPADSDFVYRNHAKAKLAFGDAVLTVFKQYHWSCRERARRLAALPDFAPWISDVRQLHQAGVDFKLHPEHRSCPAQFFLEEQAALTSMGLHLWLWLESRRLGLPFTSASGYAFSSCNLCLETNGLRNFLINLRTFGSGLNLRYPRERLFRALALLLWEPQALSDPILLRKVQCTLDTLACDFASLLSAYENLWRRFN